MKKHMSNKFTRILSMLCAATLILTMLPASLTVSAAGDLLSEMYISGAGIIDFESTTHDYTVSIPARHINGEDVYDMPAVRAVPSDSAYTAEVTYPAEVENGAAIIIEVKDNDTVLDTYTITMNLIGGNLFVDGSFEDTSSVGHWEVISGGVGLSQTTESVYGTGGLRIEGGGGSGLGWQGDVITGEGIPTSSSRSLKSGKSYYMSVMAKVASDVENISNGTRTTFYHFTTNNWNAQPGTMRGYDNGVYRNAPESTKWLDNTNWYNYVNIITPSSDEWKTLATLSNASSNAEALVMDDYFLGELVVSEVAINDENGTEVTKVPVPTDGNTEIQLNATALNQYGNTAGLEDETNFTWRLAGNYEGITLSDNGLLTIGTDAPENTEVYVEAIIAPSFANAAQDKVKGVAKIKICDVSASELASLSLNGVLVPGFSSGKTNYNYNIPYTSITGDINVDIPQVSYEKKHEDAMVEISIPEILDGGVIEVTVTSPDDVVTVYNITLGVSGQNLYPNGGFENGIKDWVGYAATLSETTDRPYSGTKAMHIKTDGVDKRWYSNGVNLEAGKTYIATSMVRLAETGSYRMVNFFHNFTGDTKYYDPATGGETTMYVYLTADWQKTMAVIKTGNSPYAPIHYYSSWSPSDPNLVVDDYYIGELIVADFEYTGKSNVTIPDSIGSVNSVNLGANMLNQFGNGAGLEDAVLEWTLKEEYPGVSIDGSKLEVSAYAVAQKITVVGTCKLGEGDSQSTVIEVPVVLETSSSADLHPRADNISISGIVANGEQLHLDYDFYQVNGEEQGETVIQWQYNESPNGTFKSIPKANFMDYDIEDEYLDKYIRCMVIPVTKDGIEGVETYSNVLVKPTAPTASSVTILGEKHVGATLRGTYTYYDINGDAPAETMYRWLIGDSEKGEFKPIKDETTGLYETSDTYVIKDTDVDKYICFEVTPVSEAESAEVAYASPAVLAATAPEVSDVTINKVSSGTYSVSYVYSHRLYIDEGISEISWIVDGSPAGNGTSVNVSTDKDHDISVTVTPIASKPPCRGKSVSDEISVEYEIKKGGSYSGGGGGSFGGSAIVPIPEQPKAPEEQKPQEVVTEPRYWASDAIDFVVSKGFMKRNDDGTFAGKQEMTRADFIYCVMKTLGAEPIEYSGEFSDVNENDYYAGYLQKAVHMGIISHDSTFNPQRPVSRQEVCKIMTIAMGIADSAGADISVFKDASNIGKWARNYVAQAVGAKILVGVSEDIFNPLGNVTYEQTAVILERLYKSRNGGTK